LTLRTIIARPDFTLFLRREIRPGNPVSIRIEMLHCYRSFSDVWDYWIARHIDLAASAARSPAGQRQKVIQRYREKF
jgi:hypothetical protein